MTNMDLFVAIFAGFLVVYLIQYLRNTVYQMSIGFVGLNRIPKVLLELANINKENGTSYENLTKEEKRKFGKINEKVSEAFFCTLTYIDAHELIHIQKSRNSYFHRVSSSDKYLIHEKLGELKDEEVDYVLYRRDNGWLQGSILIGYLLKQGQISGGKREVTPLFEFPERLMKWRFFTKSLQKKYNLKGDTVAEYIGKDELGYSTGVYMDIHETEDIKERPSFLFRIYWA